MKIFTILLLFAAVLRNEATSIKNNNFADHQKAPLAKQNGMVFGAEEWSPLFPYNSIESVKQLEKLASTGASWVRILVTWFQDSVNTTKVYPLYRPSLLASATDDELSFIIDKAHSYGLKVMLSPIVDPNWGFTTNHRSGPEQTWRGLIGVYFNESQWAEWFEGYDAYILHYIQLAEKLGVEQFCIGAELNSPFLREQEFRTLIADIRAIYSGSLTVATLFNQIQGEGWPTIQWYDAIDVIGVDGYFNLITPTDNATVDEIVQAWTPYKEKLLNMSIEWNKTVLFVECGYTSSYDAHAHPAHMDLIAFDDCSVWALCVFLEEQRKCYEALFKALYHEDWFGGVFWWLWRTDPHDGYTSDPGFSPVGKPAEDVVKHWYQLYK